MSRYVTVRLTEKEAKAVRLAAVLRLTADHPAVEPLDPPTAAAGLRACSKITDALLGDNDDQPESN